MLWALCEWRARVLTGLLKLFAETMESLGREDLLVMLSHLPEASQPAPLGYSVPVGTLRCSVGGLTSCKCYAMLCSAATVLHSQAAQCRTDCRNRWNLCSLAQGCAQLDHSLGAGRMVLGTSSTHLGTTSVEQVDEDALFHSISTVPLQECTAFAEHTKIPRFAFMYLSSTCSFAPIRAPLLSRTTAPLLTAIGASQLFTVANRATVNCVHWSPTQHDEYLKALLQSATQQHSA